MSSMKSDLVDIKCEVLYQTDKAWCVTKLGQKKGSKVEKIWIPKSIGQWLDADKIMVMPEWLAIEKGLENEVAD